MAAVIVFGPFTWVKPFGQNAMMPGDEHGWSAGNFSPPRAVVVSVLAHPTRDVDVQTLEVVRLNTSYAQTGGPSINFGVRNVGPTAIFSYRVLSTGRWLLIRTEEV